MRNPPHPTHFTQFLSLVLTPVSTFLSLSLKEPNATVKSEGLKTSHISRYSIPLPIVSVKMPFPPQKAHLSLSISLEIS